MTVFIILLLLIHKHGYSFHHLVSFYIFFYITDSHKKPIYTKMEVNYCVD